MERSGTVAGVTRMAGNQHFADRIGQPIEGPHWVGTVSSPVQEADVQQRRMPFNDQHSGGEWPPHPLERGQCTTFAKERYRSKVSTQCPLSSPWGRQ